mmetsp:Transcript_22325/g.66548  ORF Transcript_22325/g.66548 Transcript_22325/m.66548 type:complete len:264 (-) Transcript_22325:320-1111(-)
MRTDRIALAPQRQAATAFLALTPSAARPRAFHRVFPPGRPERVKMALGAARKISVDIISDTVCPWCFVGKRRLEAAMAEMKGKGVDFDVRWHPYQLDPSAPTDGVDKMKMYQEKFGKARVAQMMPMMTQTFEQVGLKYSVGGLTGNTMDSHRLIQWAGKVGGPSAQDKVVEYLFRGYFTQERFINDRALLLEAADAAGLQGAAEYLANPENGLSEVQAELAAARARAVSGVPNFTIDGRVVLSGAQDPSTFVEVFEQALQQKE